MYFNFDTSFIDLRGFGCLGTVVCGLCFDGWVIDLICGLYVALAVGILDFACFDDFGFILF